MTSATGDVREQRTGLGVFGAAALTAWSVLVTVWPLTHVVKPGRWGGESVLVVVAVLLVGLLVRGVARRRAVWVRNVLALLAQCVVLLLLLVQTSFALTATAGIFPNSAVFGEMWVVLQRAGAQVRHGAAPLESTPELAFTLSLCVALLALVLEGLIVSARLPLLAGLVIATIGIVPTVIVPGGVNIVWFVLLAVTLFLLLRLQTGEIQSDETPRPRWGMTALVGVAALVATMMIAPGVPVAATGFGTGSLTLDPSLRLGEDLRRPTVTDVMTLVTDGTQAPYLRVATLSTFDGEVWLADDADSEPLSAGFGAAEWAEDIKTKEQLTSVRVLGLSSSWLPVPYAATQVRGLEGDWRVMTDNRTVSSRRSDAAGQTYSVDSKTAVPSADQARQATASGSVASAELRALPDDLPEIITQTAADVTAGAENDYDRLIALQTWFRSNFRYSLDTPVEEGFDGTGVEAIAEFLEARSGYCVHFAGAFAVMARSLDIPTRIVVGYLPGTKSDEKQNDSPIYRVASDQLHSWPEVYFDQLGWIPFEPTATLGVPTRFVAENLVGTDNGNSADTPAVTPENSPAAEAPVDERRDQDAGASGASVRPLLNAQPIIIGIVAALFALLLPAAVRFARRVHRVGDTRRGNAEAAWAELRDTLLDLRYAASSAETPRQRGERLICEHRVDPEAMQLIVAAIEQARFSRPTAQNADGEKLTAALRSVRQTLVQRTDMRDRLAASLIPRSLLGRRVTEAVTR